MTELGNIFQPAAEGKKGPDLYVTLRAPTPVEGQPTRVHVPLALPYAGQRVTRADPHGEGEHIALGIPPGLAPGTTLRLRGAGGLSGEGGAAGDLYITIEGFEPRDGLALRARVLPSRWVPPALALSTVLLGLLLALWLIQR
ncbi:MAG: DnaJ C-terminal domain-containing protein [Polyangiales bacterium]|nr:hypothetical protein [Myxococcales bacterium]MCB9659618.1 hypothetical protein [Sandaracinaceae bacterium]